MSGKPPAFQMYAADFDMDTATWEIEEIGAYMRLLNYEWVNGGLPDDTYKLAKIVRISERKFKKTWKNLSEKFHLNGNGFLINSRMEEEREKQRKYIELQSERGKKSAVKRWGEPITMVTTTVKPALQPEGNSSSSSSLLKENTKRKRKSFLTEIQKKDFEVFWISYPKKRSKGDAEKAWGEINPSNEIQDKIIKTIFKAKQTFGWIKDKGEWIPFPATWLRAKGWEDEIEVPEDPYKDFKKVGE